MQQAAGRALHLGQELDDSSARNQRLEAQNEELSRKVAELEQRVQEQDVQARTRLEELKVVEGRVAELENNLGDKEEEAQGLRAANLRLQEEVAQQGATYKAVVQKLMQTKSFGEWILTLTVGAESWGKNLVLQQLMTACPQLLLQKSALGWDPDCKDCTDLLQQRAQKEMLDFILLNELKKE